MNALSRRIILSLSGLAILLVLAPLPARAGIITEIDGQFGLGLLSTSGADYGISASPTNYVASNLGGPGVSTFYLTLGKSVASRVDSTFVKGNSLSDLTVDVSSFTDTNPTVGMSVTGNPNGKLQLGSNTGEFPNFASFTIGGASVLTFNKTAATATIQADVTLNPGDFQFTDNSDLSPYFSGGLFTINFVNVLIVPPGDGRAFFPVPADGSKPPIITWTLTPGSRQIVPEPASVVGMVSGLVLLGGAALRRRRQATPA